MDALDKHVVLRRVLRELQHDLVCPFVHRLGERVVRLGALLVPPDLHGGVDLPPELEVNAGYVKRTDEVPRDERVVELLSRVKGRRELWLSDDVNVVSYGRPDENTGIWTRTCPPMNSSSMNRP